MTWSTTRGNRPGTRLSDFIRGIPSGMRITLSIRANGRRSTRTPRPQPALNDYATGGMHLFSSPSLTGTYTQGLTIVPNGYEGPSMCQKPGGGWRVFLDNGFTAQYYIDLKQDLSATVGPVTPNSMNNTTGS